MLNAAGVSSVRSVCLLVAYSESIMSMVFLSDWLTARLFEGWRSDGVAVANVCVLVNRKY